VNTIHENFFLEPLSVYWLVNAMSITKKYIGPVFYSLVMLACVDQSADKRAVQMDSSSKPIANEAEAIAQEIHVLINQYRAERGLSPLVEDKNFKNAAAIHSVYMDKTLISHDLFSERMADLRTHIPLALAAENVAVLSRVEPSSVAKQMVKQWITSSVHQKNLTGNYNLSGISVVAGPQETFYATQIFGRQ
jgi:uncharacterized protein YkwD